MKKLSIINLICLIPLLFLLRAYPSKAQTYIDYSTFLKKNTGISGLQFSADGQSLLYTITKVDWENNRRKTEFVVYDLVSKTSKTLQFKEKNVVQVKWSPSGKYLSYVALPDTTGATITQLHVRELANDKVKKISSSPSSIVSYQWSPGEDLLLYVTRDIPPKKVGDMKFVQAFEVGNNGYTATTQPMSAHLYIIGLDGSTAKQLTNGSSSIGEANWIDNSNICFVRNISAYSGDGTKSQIMLYDLGKNKIQPIASGFSREINPTLSPDNTLLAFSHPKNNVPANLNNISLFNLTDKKQSNLTSELDNSITGFEWMPDSKRLLLSIANKSKIELVSIGLNKKIEWLPLKNITSVGEFTVSKTGQVALIGSTMSSSEELYLYIPATKSLDKVSSYNNYLENYSLGATAAIEWPVSGGMTADGIVTYPPNFDKTKKYPLVLFIHGGPTAASFLTFSPVVQQLASNGWIVFQPNYRGSLNRGNQFQSAIANDAGFGPGEDIVKGIAALKQKGNVDEKNIAVTGWSYGGYMTAWLIGKYPKMWKAAVAGAAPVDLTDMTSLTDNNVAIRHAITTSPWKENNLKKYYEMSPIINLSKAKAPTLVMSVVGDERVSITGSYKIYHALKANDVPVQFIAYPGSTHFPTDPANQNDVYQRWVMWLKKYLD